MISLLSNRTGEVTVLQESLADLEEVEGMKDTDWCVASFPTSGLHLRTLLTAPTDRPCACSERTPREGGLESWACIEAPSQRSHSLPLPPRPSCPQTLPPSPPHSQVTASAGFQPNPGTSQLSDPSTPGRGQLPYPRRRRTPDGLQAAPFLPPCPFALTELSQVPRQPGTQSKKPLLT